VIETYTLASSIVAADIAVKAAQVELIEIRLPFALGGKAFVILTGDVSSVRTAVDSAVNVLKDEGVLESFTVIPQPSKELVQKML
jgi:microcompartment protein CcmL/EutN